MRNPGRFSLLTAAALAFSACAPMTVSSYVARDADFAQYRTWDWGPADTLPTGDPRLDNNAMFKDYLEGAVEKQFATRHYERSTSGTPDLLVHYHANISKTFDVNGVDRTNGYCYDNCQPNVIEYEQGTLVIDVVDTHTEKVVWRGWAQSAVDGIIDDQDLLEKQVGKAVTRMMAEFPRHL